jgi:hypothetical protein
MWRRFQIYAYKTLIEYFDCKNLLIQGEFIENKTGLWSPERQTHKLSLTEINYPRKPTILGDFGGFSMFKTIESAKEYYEFMCKVYKDAPIKMRIILCECECELSERQNVHTPGQEYPLTARSMNWHDDTKPNIVVDWFKIINIIEDYKVN